MSNRPVHQGFADWFSDLMRAAGYSPEGGARVGGRSRLAKDAHVSASAVTRLLDEGRIPSVPTMRAFARCLGTSLPEMLVRAGLADPDDFPDGTNWPTTTVIEAINADPTLGPEDRTALIKHYKGLVQFARQRTELEQLSELRAPPSVDPREGRDPPAPSRRPVTPARAND